MSRDSRPARRRRAPGLVVPLLALLALLALMACGSPRPSVPAAPPPAAAGEVAQAAPQPEPPLAPPQPTLRLPRNFEPTGYRARLAIDPARPTFEGSIEIAGKVAKRSATIWLHARRLTVKRAVARRAPEGDRATEVILDVTPRGDDLLEVRPRTPLDAGTWTLAFDYAGELDAIGTVGAFRQRSAGKWYVFTQLEAIYARRVFPCIDEPDRKVPWQLTLDVPAKLVAVANTPEVRSTPLDADTRRVEFAESKPLPSYLVAFAVGPFELVDAGKTRNGTPMRVITLANRQASAAWAARTLPPLVAAIEDWFGTPYPYAKLDVISIPITVGFGAMENAGLITFTETLILVDPDKASRGRQHRWVVVAAHEIAHQWFGNLVTMKFWDDIWLNEGFANWLEHKVTSAIDPAYRDDQADLGTRNRALGADALVSARQIRQPIESADDILNAFDSITYNKGASVLNMFERYLGTATFQRGVRAYLASRAWGNATSQDFASAIARVSGNAQIPAAFASFLEQPGAPEITATLACTGGKASVELAQRRYVPPGSPAPAPGKPWLVPVCVAYDKAGARAEACTLLAGQAASLPLDTARCPRWVMPNVDGRGYYRNAYTVAQITALRDEAWPKLSWTERRAVFFDVRAAATSGRLPLQLALSFVPRLLAGADRFTIGPALDLVTGLDELVPDALRPKYEYWLRTTFGPGAVAAGFLPKEHDTLDVERTREDLIAAVAWTARDPALVAEAVKLAARWRELPQAIRGLVLAIAVDARRDVFARVLSEVRREKDRARRQEMLAALAAVRDPGRRKRALALILVPALDIRETIRLLRGGTEATIAVAQQFFRDHHQAILARLPQDETARPIAGMAALFTATCKADQRDAIAAYVKQTFGPLPGGMRVVDQHVERMDQCIARRRLLEPEVRAWLGGLRLPRSKP